MKLNMLTGGLSGLGIAGINELTSGPEVILYHEYSHRRGLLLFKGLLAPHICSREFDTNSDQSEAGENT